MKKEQKTKKKKKIKELIDDEGAIIQGDKPTKASKTGSKSTTDQYGKTAGQRVSVKGAYGGFPGGIFGLGASGAASESLIKQAFKEKIMEILDGTKTNVEDWKGIPYEEPDEQRHELDKSIIDESPSIFRAASYFAMSLDKEGEFMQGSSLAKIIGFILDRIDKTKFSVEDKQFINSKLNA